MVRESTNTVNATGSESINEGSGGERKRKRGDDDDVLANLHLPSVTSSIHNPKKRRPLVPNVPIPSTPACRSLPSSSAGVHSSVEPVPRTTNSSTTHPHLGNGADQTAGAAKRARKENVTTTQNDTFPPGFDDATDLGERQPTPTSALEDSNEGTDLYGPPVRLEQPLRGFYATLYYPYRTSPFQIPTGKLSDAARAERYKNLSEEEIVAREAGYQDECEKCPLVFQEAFKHTARGRLDKIAHIWLVPRIHNYYQTDQEGRSSLLDRIVRDLVHEFSDLHPNFLKLKNFSMEKDYFTGLRNLVSVACSGIKSNLENPSKVESINKEIFQRLTGSVVPSRPHDMWYKSIIDRLKEPEGEEEEDNSEAAELRKKLLAEARALQDGWEATYNSAKNIHGAKYAVNNRLKIQQEYRKEKFGKAPNEEQAFWVENAAKAEKAIDPITALISALPIVNLVNTRFCEIAKVPMVIMIGAPDHQNPGQYIVYHDTYSPAPSKAPDFFDGPDRFGETTLIPQFRKFTAQCFGAPNKAVAVKGIPLPATSEVADDSAEMDAETAQETACLAETAGRAETVGIGKIKSKIKEFLVTSFKKAHNKQRFHFGNLVSRFDHYIDLSILPTTRITSVLEADGTPALKETTYKNIVYPTNPRDMTWYQVKAYFELLKDPNSTFAWRVEATSTTGNLNQPPASVRESLLKSQPIIPTTKAPGKRNKSNSQSQPASHSRASSQSTKPGVARNPKRGPESEEDAVSSDEEAQSSDFSVGDESSADEGYRPNTEYRMRPETFSRTGRRSAPPAHLAVEQAKDLAVWNPMPFGTVAGHGDLDDDSDEPRSEPKDTTRPAPFTRKPAVTVSKNASLLISPEKNSSKGVHVSLNAMEPYVFKSRREHESTGIPSTLATALEYISELTIPESYRDSNLPSMTSTLPSSIA
ncbi:hypothetical protein FS837_004822 [Tulasnella sp. UAMH 9824]|nr:hypothetical protein FS837_004822 [Tulasnella sp. UAMH 9824]